MALVWLALGLQTDAHAGAAMRPLVLELFTSQGCSSCPHADQFLKKLAEDPNVLALSFHVDYWDYLGWKDPFASADNTRRQRIYALLHKDRLYTPQLVIDGADAVIGSHEWEVESAMASVRSGGMQIVPISLSTDTAEKTLNIHIADTVDSPKLPASATVWAMQFKKDAVTSVQAGENRGRTIENINNVVHITRLGTWNRKPQDYQLRLSDLAADGVAILLQADAQGQIIGATSFSRTP